MGDLHEQLSQQFYQWEQRGRGWQVANTTLKHERGMLILGITCKTP